MQAGQAGQLSEPNTTLFFRQQSVLPSLSVFERPPKPMIRKRYSCIFADRSSGAVHRFTVSVRPVIAVCLGILAVPIGYTVQDRWASHTEIEQLRLQNARLELENSS